jgi:hypothetical protein
VNFNAKDTKGIRKGAQRKLYFATFAAKFNDSLSLKLVLTQPLNRWAIIKCPHSRTNLTSRMWP